MKGSRSKILFLILLISIFYAKIEADTSQVVDRDTTIPASLTSSENNTSPTEINDQPDEQDNAPANSSDAKPSLYLIDTIKVVVFGDDRTDLITDLDCKRPSLDGTKRSLEDLVLENLIYQDAVRYKMLPSEESNERHLLSVQRENNLSLEDLKNIFQAAGYSFEEGKSKFGIMSAVGSMLDFKIRSRLIVPEKDIEQYYNEHPAYSDETYELASSFIKRVDDQTLEEINSEIEQLIQTGASSLNVSWSEPFWVKVDEISANRQFIKEMQPGQIAIAQESEEGIEIIKLMSKQERRLLSLEDRYQEIADALRLPKYEELFNKYKRELFDHASLIYF